MSSKAAALCPRRQNIIQVKVTTQRTNRHYHQQFQNGCFSNKNRYVASDLTDWIRPSGSELKDPIDLHRFESFPG